ncbi:MAG TPA: hypothetical protein VE621_24555 [Bryobacteraceae bacterium]|jgi:translation initiation factor 2B subunit (eIF-2B alpha/beta/delta family)|nr:hypothetical protein [Bryobacteraceae bacterium]
MKSIISILFTVALGFAQTPVRVNPAAPPSTDVLSVVKVKASVGLPDAQVTALTTIHQNAQQAVQPVQQDLLAKEQALSDALEKGSTDSFALGNLMLEIAAARKTVNQAEPKQQRRRPPC